MANSDYTLRGTGSFCTIAVLSAAVNPLDTVLNITGLRSVGPGDRFVGMAVLLGDEVVRLDAIGSGTITVARGCADTIPAYHASGTEVWFFENAASSDNVEYVASGTIGVKVLPATTSATMPIAYAPPIELEFNSRFIRPYPPADFKVEGVPWFTYTTPISSTNTELNFTWAHRNRVVQQDVLIGHTEASVSPEAGTTYVARVYKASDNSLLRTVTGITTTSWNYTASMAATDIGSATPPVAIYIDIVSARDGHESWQKYRTFATVT